MKSDIKKNWTKYSQSALQESCIHVLTTGKKAEHNNNILQCNKQKAVEIDW